jgi:hypothetical protein
LFRNAVCIIGCNYSSFVKGNQKILRHGNKMRCQALTTAFSNLAALLTFISIGTCPTQFLVNAKEKDGNLRRIEVSIANTGRTPIKKDEDYDAPSYGTMFEQDAETDLFDFSLKPLFDSTHTSHTESVDTLSSNILSTSGVPRTLMGTMLFGPLSSCNANLDSADCTAVTFSSIVSAGTLDADGRLVIPCGTCVFWDSDALPDVVDVPEGLNIEGKLHMGSEVYRAQVPQTLNTTSIVVQGIWSIDPPVYSSPAEPLKTFQVSLYGFDLQYLHPHSENAAVCSSTAAGCTLGKKPIAVAGGTLDIRGIANQDTADCPSWVKLHDLSLGTVGDRSLITVSARESATSGNFIAPNLSCWRPGDEILITSPDSDFSSANEATIVSVDESTGEITLDRDLDEWFVHATQLATLDEDNDARFAIEVARLSRSIIFQAEEDDPTNGDNTIGGHLIILHTPVAEQLLLGVELQNFGQQGNLGRYVSLFFQHSLAPTPHSHVTLPLTPHFVNIVSSCDSQFIFICAAT